MSAKSRAGKAAWSARAATYPQDLINRIAGDSKARLDAAHKPMRNLAQRAVIQCCIKIRGL